MIKRLPISEINRLYQIYVPRKKVYTQVYTKLNLALQQSLDRLDKNNGYLGVNAGSSFSIIGTSGLGKTSMIHACISEIGNDIITIDNSFITADVLPFLYVNCPPDCSIKSLLFSILQLIDDNLHTHYMDAVSIKFTTEQLFTMLKTAVSYIGVLIIDECQNLAKFRAGNTLINYLTALANTGLSVCLSATEELIPFLSSDSSLKRRYQPILLKPYEYDDDFKELASTLLSCQFHSISIDDSLLYWLFLHSAGLPSQLVELIYQANLSTTEEYLTLKDFEMVFDNMLFKPVIKPFNIKSSSEPASLVLATSRVGNSYKQPIDLIHRDKSIDILSILKSHFEVIEL